MANNVARGRFVWHELMTPSTADAHAFYSKALGWRIEPWEGDPSYAMFAAPSGPLGAAVAMTERTAHWVPYVAIPDIDATVQQALHLGASVIRPPTTIPNGSRYAVVNDPQGAVFAIYESAADLGPEAAPRPGEFCWHELAAVDYRAAMRFYTALFGWDTLAEHDMGPMGVYLIFGRAGTQLGGMFSKGDSGLPGAAYWLGYVRVADVNAAVRDVKSARGTLVHGPMEVPGGEWIAQCTDPQGALFAVHALTGGAAREQAEQQPAKRKPAKQKPAKKKASAKKRTAKAAKPAKPATAKTKAKKKSAKKKSAKKKTKKTAQKKTKRKVKQKTRNKTKKVAAKTTRKAAKKRPGPQKKRKKKAARKKR